MDGGFQGRVLTNIHKVHEAAIIYFDAVWRAGSIRSAARKLNVASSAVNRQIIKLEAALGTALFDRVPGGIRLNAAGEVFAHHAATVVQDYERTISRIHTLQGMVSGHVEIVTQEGLCVDLLPEVAAAISKRYPSVTLGFDIRPMASLSTSVVEGEAHLAVAFQIARHPGLVQLAVGRFNVGAIMRPDHELAAKPRLSIRDCARYPLIVVKNNLAMHSLIQPALSRLQFGTQQVIETASLEIGKQLALRGVGIAFQTRIGLEKELLERRLVHIPIDDGGPVTQELGVYARTRATLAPAADAFQRVVMEEIARRQAEDARPA